VLFAILLSRFLLYEIRAATSFEVKALQHLQLLHTVPRWKKTVKSIISDNKLRKHMPCAKPEDILNASIRVISCVRFRFLQHWVLRLQASGVWHYCSLVDRPQWFAGICCLTRYGRSYPNWQSCRLYRSEEKETPESVTLSWGLYIFLASLSPMWPIPPLTFT
jgi:hypothetical protein